MAEQRIDITEIGALYQRKRPIPALGEAAVEGVLQALIDNGYHMESGHSVIVDDEVPLTVDRALGRGEVRQVADQPGAIVGPYFIPSQGRPSIEDYRPNGIGVWLPSDEQA